MRACDVHEFPEHGNKEVAYACGRYGACPRMLLFENAQASLTLFQKARQQPDEVQHRQDACKIS